MHADTTVKWVLADAGGASFGEVLQELTKVIDKSPKPRYLCSADQVIPGFPMIPKNAVHKIHDYRQCFETPWGWVKKAHFAYYDYHSLSYFGGIYQIIDSDSALPNEKSYAALPAATIPELGYAKLDVITGAVSVFTGSYANDAANDAMGAKPVWDSRISVHSLQSPSDRLAILRDIRQGLQQRDIAVYPTDLLVKVSLSQYPWHRRGLPARPASISNNEISVAITGFAVNGDGQLIYVSLVGHKTSCRSIWGSLNTAHRRYLALEFPGSSSSSLRVTSTHNYASFSQPVGNNGQYRLMIVHKNAFANPAVDESYCITPWIDDAATDRAFATRLDALLPIGIKPEWGRRLRQAGLKEDLAECCTAGGDVQHAYRLKTDGWLDLVNDLLQAGELVF